MVYRNGSRSGVPHNISRSQHRRIRIDRRPGRCKVSSCFRRRSCRSVIRGGVWHLYLFNERLQYPVGNGFFHAGRVTTDVRNSTDAYTYIYDCGTVGATVRDGHPTVDLDGCVGDLQDSNGWNESRVDALFISHFHSDHVSGVRRILEAFRPRLIVIPYTDIIDRVAAAIAHETDAATADFFVDLILDPVEAMQRAFADLFGDNVTAPAIIVVNSTDNPPDEIAEDLEPQQTTGWRRPDGSIAPIAPGQVTSSDDHGHIRVASSVGSYWLLKPWVDPMLATEKDQFRNAITAVFGILVAEVDTWLNDANHIRAVVDRLYDVTRHLRDQRHRFNVTSMSLYSGPVGPFHFFELTTKDLVQRGNKLPVGWLAAGDAELGESGRRSRFLRHYINEHGSVTTLALPHHGSRHNFHADLLTTFKPKICVVGSGGLYGHPHHEVKRAVSKAGISMVVADTGRSPALRELVWAHF